MSEKFGNYEVLRRLAAGGMAEVLLAKQRGLGGFERLVCIKRILPHLSAQEDFLKMFQDEARIAANLVHPNIAQIYDIAQEGDDYYIAMEYVRGEDLRRVYNQEVARGHAIAPHVAAQVAMGAAAGLDYAHRQSALDGRPLGLVHRDISPQNIVVTYDGHVKLIDFGVAKARGKLNETRSGVLKGKYSYMSPEQASGDPVDGRTDIFALGITLYEVTTGTRLFKRENELETLHAVIACNVRPPSQVQPGYDPALEQVVMRALAYDADGRYATAGEMERDLEAYLRGGNHPTGAAQLATYMHDLFAAKLADEALFGGPPWSESATASRRAPRPTPAAHEPTQSVAAPPGQQAHEGSAPAAHPDEHSAPHAPGAHAGSAPPGQHAHEYEGSGQHAHEYEGSAPPGQHAHEYEGSAPPEQGTLAPPDATQVAATAPEPSAPAAAADAADAAVWETADERLERTSSDVRPRFARSAGGRARLDATQLLATTPPPPPPEPEPVAAPEPEPEPLVPPPPPPAPPPRRWITVLLVLVTSVATLVFARRVQQARSAEAARLAALAAATTPVEPPEPSIAADDPNGYLTVRGAVPLSVSLGGRTLGETPLRHLPLPPGSYRLRLASAAEGLVLRRDVRVDAARATQVRVGDARNLLRVEGRPWAWVRVGLRPAAETPQALRLLYGDYTVTLECPDGRRKFEPVSIGPGEPQALTMDCES